MDEDDLYDEFGNYVGPELGSDEDEDLEEKRFEEVPTTTTTICWVDEEAALVVRVTVHRTVWRIINAIVLHEDKHTILMRRMYPGWSRR